MPTATAVLIHAVGPAAHAVLLGCRERGAIAGISSVAVIRRTSDPYPGHCTSQAAVDSVTVAIARAFGLRGIRTNVIGPGLTGTPHIGQNIPGLHESNAAMVAARQEQRPTGRVGTA